MREVGADAETIGRRSLQHPITTAALHLQPHSVNVLLVCCFVISCFFFYELGAWFQVNKKKKKTRAKHHDVNVYVSHDLTRGEQERRRALVPQYKALRSKGIICHLPKDTITQNGKSLTPSEVEGLLKDQ